MIEYHMIDIADAVDAALENMLVRTENVIK
jgi:hypothetical protein